MTADRLAEAMAEVNGWQQFSDVPADQRAAYVLWAEKILARLAAKEAT